MYSWNDGAYLMHHGIKGQKWGQRRFQNDDGSLTQAGKQRYLKEMHRDMESHFKRQLSNKRSRDLTSLGKNGYDNRGMAWGEAYRRGEVTSKDDAEIRRAAAETRRYAKAKYGEDAVKALSASGFFYKSSSDFEPRLLEGGKSIVEAELRTAKPPKDPHRKLIVEAERRTAKPPKGSHGNI